MTMPSDSTPAAGNGNGGTANGNGTTAGGAVTSPASPPATGTTTTTTTTTAPPASSPAPEPGWYLCSACSALFRVSHSSTAVSVCPAGGEHQPGKDQYAVHKASQWFTF